MYLDNQQIAVLSRLLSLRCNDLSRRVAKYKRYSVGASDPDVWAEKIAVANAEIKSLHSIYYILSGELLNRDLQNNQVSFRE